MCNENYDEVAKCRSEFNWRAVSYREIVIQWPNIGEVYYADDFKKGEGTIFGSCYLAW